MITLLALIKFALIKRYHLHMCNRAMLLFGKFRQWNLHVNSHVNGTTFQSSLRFQAGLSSLRVWCKHALVQHFPTFSLNKERSFINTVFEKLRISFIDLTPISILMWYVSTPFLEVVYSVAFIKCFGAFSHIRGI